VGLDHVKTVLLAEVENALVAGLLGLGASAAWLEGLAVLADGGCGGRGRGCLSFGCHCDVVCDWLLWRRRRWGEGKEGMRGMRRRAEEGGCPFADDRKHPPDQTDREKERVVTCALAPCRPSSFFTP